jgi:hypothetical protein
MFDFCYIFIEKNYLKFQFSHIVNVNMKLPLNNAIHWRFPTRPIAHLNLSKFIKLEFIDFNDKFIQNLIIPTL